VVLGRRVVEAWERASDRKGEEGAILEVRVARGLDGAVGKWKIMCLQGICTGCAGRSMRRESKKHTLRRCKNKNLCLMRISRRIRAIGKYYSILDGK
jgi:hypothetical protein